MLRKPVIAAIAAAALLTTDAAFAQSQCTVGGGGVWDSLCRGKRKHIKKKVTQEAPAASDGQEGESVPPAAPNQAGNGSPQNGQPKPAQCVPTADKPCPQ